MKGETKSGIKFEMDERIKDDTRILYYLTFLQTPDIDPMDASKGIFELLGLIFGSQENVLAFMNEVADKNKGVCDTKTMLTELTEMFEILGSKKS